MRALLALLLLAPLLPGCSPYIAMKDDFGTSALVASGDVPPEFTEFNAYDPAVNNLVSNQICATSYEPLEERGVGAVPGQLVQARGRCRQHVPLFGP
ncbi:MAG TPA: hypothetical protein VHY35_17395 [Stellaceae bacterium]|jgi:hypothetical protein|nr:hypothetical protein [Stellaceae bacterium]